MNSAVDMSVVIPLFNEAKSLPDLRKRLTQTLTQMSLRYEIIFVNDGSRDATLQTLKDLSTQDCHIRYISLTRNFGHQPALIAGLHKCQGKAIVIMDGDLQDPPELIPVLYAKYADGYKVVTAQRKLRKGETVFKRFTAKIFYRLFAHVTNFNMPLDAGDFRIIDRGVVDALKGLSERNLFIRGQIAWLGFKTTSVEFVREERKYGKTNYSIGRMIRFAFDGITSFSNFPLKLATMTGFIISGAAFIIIIYALVSWMFLNRTVSGWTSIIISSMIIGGTQLITIGIIGEYLGRINIDVKQRPFYVVEEENIPSEITQITEA